MITPPKSCIEEGTILCVCVWGGELVGWVHVHTRVQRKRRDREKGKKLLFITLSVVNSGIQSVMCRNHYILHNLLCVLM